jgi:dihydropteroate synthase
MSDRPNETSDEAHRWVTGSRTVVIDRPFVFGILNVTPDSFSDGGRFDAFDAAIAHAQDMLEQGADAIDIGGESTRPQGARVVSVDEETRRVIPIVRGLRVKFPAALISVDTTKSEVAAAAMDAGADIINDVSGFRLDPRMGEIVAAGGAGVVLMHSRGSVSEMGTYLHANYVDTVGDVISELEQSLQRAATAGVRRECVVLDPGVGFAKRSEHSLRILNELRRVVTLGLPTMVGVSRKRFVGELARVETTDQRVAGTIGANVAALMNGARLFRVHDVAPNRQALDVAWAVLRAGPGSRFPVPGSRSE